jgi:hypothetical protein
MHQTCGSPIDTRSARLIPVGTLAGVAAVALVMHLYRLRDLPGELYGDIAIIYELVERIRAGRWPFQFVASNGPLYGYLIAPVIAVTGPQGYLGYKLASVLVGFVSLAATYWLLRTLLTFSGAAFGVLTLAASSWFLIFSRLGNAQIVIPALTAASYALLLAGARDRPRLVTLGLVVALLGLYVMPQTFVLPLAYLLSAWLLLGRARLAELVFGPLLLAAPFLVLIALQRDLFLSDYGYIGSKVALDGSALEKLWSNVIRSLLMFHVAGDKTFRSNPPGQPQLDVLSGLLFLIGLAACLVHPGRVRLAAFWVPFLVLQIPANLVLNEGSPTPSASRTIGIVPFVAYAIAVGAMVVVHPLRRSWPKAAVLGGLAVFIVIGNWSRYFTDYAANLPDGNTPIGRMIATEVDGLPDQATVFMYGCCWGEWGQPEPKGVEYVVRQRARIKYVESGRFSCELLLGQPMPVYVIWDPRMMNAAATPETCDAPMQPAARLGPRGDVVYVMFSPAID